MFFGKIEMGPVSVVVFEDTDGPTGMLPQINPVDQFMGTFEFRFNPDEAKIAESRSGISAEKVGYFFLAWAVAKALLGQADSRFDTAITAETFLQAFVGQKERREAQNLLNQLVSLELSNAMLGRLPEAPEMEVEFLRLRQLALKRYPIEVEPLQPGRYPRILGAWGERVDSTVRNALPFFREHFARKT